MITTKVQIRNNRIGAITRRVNTQVKIAVDKTCKQIELQAKEDVALDTSTLQASIHRVTEKFDGYDIAVSEAQARNDIAVLAGITPKGRTAKPVEFYPKVEPDRPNHGIVAVAAEYGGFVEFGTIHQSAQPFVTPAAETARGAHVSNVTEGIRKGLGS